jgi:hypothetical protein
MKGHIGVDAESGLVHTVRGTAGSVNDVVEANALLHGEETEALAGLPVRLLVPGGGHQAAAAAQPGCLELLAPI